MHVCTISFDHLSHEWGYIYAMAFHCKGQPTCLASTLVCVYGMVMLHGLELPLKSACFKQYAKITPN